MPISFYPSPQPFSALYKTLLKIQNLKRKKSLHRKKLQPGETPVSHKYLQYGLNEYKNSSSELQTCLLQLFNGMSPGISSVASLELNS